MVLSTTGFLFGMIEVLVGYGKRRDTAMVLWGCANLAAGVGAGLLSAQGVLPYVLSEAAADGFLALCFSLVWAGMREFAGQPIPWAIVVAGPLLPVIGCLFIPPFTSNIVMRIHLVSIVLVAYLLLLAKDCLRAERTERLTIRRVMAVVCIVAAISVIWRSVSAQLHSGTYDLMGNSASAATPLVALFITATVINICLLLVGRERLGNQLARAAVVDGLTGTLNRAGFLVEAKRVADACEQLSQPCSVIVMDLDEFKAVNDHHGHAAGDLLLAGFASIAESNLRHEDVLGRIGGEEFCALLPGVNQSQAVDIADRLRLAFGETGFDVTGTILKGTVSMGVAQVCIDEELAASIQWADMAIYQAKSSGRDRVACAPPLAQRSCAGLGAISGE